MSHKQLWERCWDAIECNEVKCVKSQAQFKQLRFKMFYYLKWVILSYCLRDMYLIKLYPLFKFNYCCKFILLVIIGFILCIAESTMAPKEEADSVLGSSWRKLSPKLNYLSWWERITQTTTIIAPYSMIYTHLHYLLENGCTVCIMSVTVWSSWCCNFYYFIIFSACQIYNLFSLLAVCRAFPVKMPYNTVWLTTQQQTAAAFSKSIGYYTTFPPFFSAAVEKQCKRIVLHASVK